MSFAFGQLSSQPDIDAGAALNALARFFQNNQALTREEFSLLVNKSQNRNPGSRA